MGKGMLHQVNCVAAMRVRAQLPKPKMRFTCNMVHAAAAAASTASTYG